MTREQFEKSIVEGVPLVLLDNLVLNVGQFINQHPGGRFVIRHNIGHDIGKYFYGGYSLEDNLTRLSPQGHVHSQTARTIVNDLIVAVYEDDIQTSTLVC